MLGLGRWVGTGEEEEERPEGAVRAPSQSLMLREPGLGT